MQGEPSMENPALSERKKIDALGAAGLTDPSLVPPPMLGFAQARLGESPSNSVAAVGGCSACSGDHLEVDFAQPAGPVPDFGWLGTTQNPSAPMAPAVAPSGPADPLSGQMAQGNEGTWGAEDEAMLEKALASGASEPASALSGASSAGPENSKYDQLFGQFGQSQEGNCASVAVIKAALDKYEGKVFQSVKKSGDGYDVTQQDGKKLAISKGELQKAAKAADLKGKPNEAKSMAVLMFATLAKRGAEEGMGNFDQVLKKLNSGFDPKKAAQLLGLGNKIKPVDPASAGNKDGVVAWNNKHAVYLDEGKADSYGQAKAADGTDTRGGKLTQAFTFA
jgi:pyruvate/2-oxoglutarate dehydrogenase complex dihydrolipoamide acyltransferase (E2) component